VAELSYDETGTGALAQPGPSPTSPTIIYSGVPLPPPIGPAPVSVVGSTPPVVAPTSPVVVGPSPTSPIIIYSGVPLPPPIGPAPVSVVGSLPPAPTPTPTPTPTTGPGSPGYGVIIVPSEPTWQGVNYDVGPILGVIGTPAAEGGWSYFKSVIDGDFTNLESAFEAISGSSLAGGTDVALLEVGAGIAADIEDLPVIGIAAALLLGEYAIGWIIKQVGALFPDPSIFGWRPLNFIQEGLTRIGNGFESAALGLIDPIAHVFITPIRQLLGLFQRGGNATAAAHNKAKTLATQTIPQARNDAIASAGHYTDQQVATLNASITAQIDKVRTDTQSLVNAVKASIATSEAQLFAPLEAQLLSQLSSDERTLAGLTTEVQTVLPAEVAAQVNDATAAENQRLTSTAANLQSNIDASNSQITNLQTSIGAANTDIANAQRQLVQLGPETAANTDQIQALLTDITTAQDDINQWTKTISDLETQITGISTTLGNTTAAQQLNTAQLAPFEIIGGLGLATVIATLTSTLNNLKTKVDTCMVDNCDQTSPNSLRNALLALLATITDVAELGFLAEAVRDPTGTADTLAPSLEAIDSGAVDTLNALLSL
jgi:hypothetical protein